MRSGMRWRAAALALGLCLALAAGGRVATSALEESAAGRARQTAWSRPLEPAMLAGSQLALFNGAAVHDLFVYAYRGGAWQPVPFQLDEVDATGVYTTTENGVLDGNDELVFMAGDLGEEASPAEWIADADAQGHPRYRVQVTNPLSPAEQGWVYVYRSTGLVPSPGDYVSWDGVNQRIVAQAYILGQAPAAHAGVDALELNGTGVDIVDRSKMRIDATCWIFGVPVPIMLTEEDLVGFEVAPDIDGPVRVGGGSVESSAWSYAASFQSSVSVDLDAFEPPPYCTSLTISSTRISIDLLSPTQSGMAPATYFDANTPAGVPIDGVPDDVPGLPFAAWRQVTGGRGSLVQVAQVSLGGGSVSNYYKDDQTVDPEDTGEDQQSFADAGVTVQSPSGLLRVASTAFVLGADQPNVGATYWDNLQHPLEAAATPQEYEPPCEPVGVEFGWDPQPVYSGVETTFAASVGSGQAPFSYAWTFGDDGSTPTGNPVAHIFALSGTYPVTLVVSNACGSAAPVRHDVPVFDPSSAHRLYLPLVERSQP